MKHYLFRILTALALMLMPQMHAEPPAELQWKLSNATAISYSAPNLSPGKQVLGYQKYLDKQWKVISVSFRISFVWPKESTTFKADNDEIYIEDNQHNQYPMIGISKPNTIIDTSRDKIYEYSNDENGDKFREFEYAFIVPRTARGLVLHIKDQHQKLKKQIPTKKTDIKRAFDIRVKSVNVVPHVTFKQKINSHDLIGRASNPNGKIVKVTFQVLWRSRYYKGMAKTTYVDERWFALQTNTGAWCPSYGRLVDSKNEYDSGKKVSTTELKPLTMTCYFPIPKTSSSAKLYFAGQQFCNFSIQQ